MGAIICSRRVITVIDLEVVKTLLRMLSDHMKWASHRLRKPAVLQGLQIVPAHFPACLREGDHSALNAGTGLFAGTFWNPSRGREWRSIGSESGSQRDPMSIRSKFWTPIPRLRGSILQAE
jgi:hypothetical protein